VGAELGLTAFGNTLEILKKGAKTMTHELTSRSQSSNQPAILKLRDGDPFLKRMDEIYNSLARRAYELFDGRGRQDGHDLEDWLRAESEFLHPTPVEISEADDQVIVRADVPGFRDKDIEVRVEPHRLIISGRREQVHDQKNRRALYSERRSDEVCRVVDLSEEIDSDKVRATLQDGTLEITLPKARPAKKVPVSAKAA
jgi:HSP20 family protein